MAIPKEFVTRFNIGAVWTGQRGVNQATAALNKTAATAQKVNLRIKGLDARRPLMHTMATSLD